jgi:hypothetical protein
MFSNIQPLFLQKKLRLYIPLVYIDASASCNSLTFQIGSVTFTRQWNIKVTQYAMDFPNKAPQGRDLYIAKN